MQIILLLIFAFISTQANAAVPSVLTILGLLQNASRLTQASGKQPEADVIVEVGGYGKTSDEAFINAKKAAVNVVAGSYISGNAKVVGNTISDTTTEYSAGYIRRVEVLSTEQAGGLVHARIRAWVDPHKNNEIIESKKQEVTEKIRDQLAQEQNKHAEATSAVHTQEGEEESFAFHVTRVTFNNHGESTDVRIEFDVVWTPKWYDDLHVLAKTIGAKTAFARGDAEYMTCFADVGENYDCYDIKQSLHAIPVGIPVSIRFDRLDGSSIDRPWTVFASRGDLYANTADGTWGKPSKWDGYFKTHNIGVILYRNGVIHDVYENSIPTDELLQTKALAVMAR